MMTRLLKSGAMLSALLLAAVPMMTGCGEKLADNQVFLDQQKVLEHLDEDTKVLGRHIDDVEVSLASLRRDVRTIKNAPQAGERQFQVLENRLVTLENSLNEQLTKLARLETKMKEQAKAAMDVAANRSSRGSTSRADAAGKNPSIDVAKVTRSRAARVELTSAPRGFYHLIREGESAQEIAGRNRISVATLFSANRIPAGRRLFPGQRIYIPAS